MTVRSTSLIAVTVYVALVLLDVRASAEMPHVRVLDPLLADLLIDAHAASPTLRSLVDRLQHSDVIVHIESRPQRMANVGGMVQFVTHAAGYRYVRVTIHVPVSSDGAIVLLGHELQHAVEIADDPSVMDGVTLEALYRRIGHECHRSFGATSYDTPLAREVGQRVLDETRNAIRADPPYTSQAQPGKRRGPGLTHAIYLDDTLSIQ